MLYTALAYCIISLVCFIAGIVFYELWPSGAGASTPPRSFIVYIITGLIIVTGMAQWLALFMPLTVYTSLAVVTLLFLLFLVRRKRVLHIISCFYRNFGNTSLLFRSGAIVFVLMIAVLNAGPIIMDDTDSYHIQAVKWLQEYGTVPGLANLHLRYGFNSSWFSSIGLLSPRINDINAYTVLNGALSCWLCIYLFKKATAMCSKGMPASGSINLPASLFMLLIAGILIWPMVRGNAASANYDFITTCCIIVLFIEAFTTPGTAIKQEYILWTCFLFTVRILNFPLLLLAVFLLWKHIQNKEFRKIMGGILAAVFLITPFIARNIILSGYAFFPVYEVDLFSVDWKADREMMVNIVEFVKYYNRVNTTFMPLEETSRLAFPGWISAWYHYLFTYDKILISASLLCFIASLFGMRRLRSQKRPGAGIIIEVLLAQVFVWFFVAPDLRFVYGPLLCFIVLFALSLPPVYVRPVFKTSGTIGAWILLAGCLFYTGKKIMSSADYQHVVTPVPLPVPSVQQVVIDGIWLNIPGKFGNNWNARCYGTDLPCLYNIHPGLRARGKNIADGFYIDHNKQYVLPKGAWY